MKIITLIYSKYNPIKLISYLLRPIKNQKLYIHIGMPKTGSSAIQAFLALNSKYLKKNGFSYPNHTGFKQAFQTSAGNSAEISTWIKNGNTNIFRKFITKVRSKNVILSSEILYSSLREHPKKFAKFFSKYDIKIICYIREIGDLAESCTNQMIKNHNMVDYSNVKGNIAGFNYYTCLLRAIEFIGIDKMIVKKYDNCSFYNGNIYADFMKVLDLEIDDVNYPEKHVNPSLNRDALEFRILLNKSLFAKNNIHYKYKINGLLAGYSVFTTNSEKFALISQEMRNDLTDEYKKLDKQLNSIFFMNDRESIFPSNYKAYKQYKGLKNEIIAQILKFIQDNDESFYIELIQFVTNELNDLNDKEKILSANKLLN